MVIDIRVCIDYIATLWGSPWLHFDSNGISIPTVFWGINLDSAALF